MRLSFSKPYFLLAYFLIIIQSVQGQKDLSTILQRQQNYQRIIQDARQYFDQKHPDLSPAQMLAGPHRDGDFVKFKRWEYFWKHQQQKNGQLGDPTPFYRQPKSTLRSENPFTDITWKNIGLTKNLGGQIGLGRTTSIDFHPSEPNTFYLSTAVGGIWKTQDRGKTYQAIGDQLPTLAVAAVLVDHEKPTTLYAATGDRVWYGYPSIGVYKSEDDGQNWQETALKWPFSNGIKVYAMVANPSNAQEIYLACDRGLFQTTDGFKTVKTINSFRAFDVQFKPGDPSIIYFTADGQFWRSTDSGQSFQSIYTIPDPNNMRITVSPANPNLVYVSNGNTLYQSSNSGQNFLVTQDISSLDNGSLGYAYLSPSQANEVYGGYFSSWKSINGGQDWQQITCFSGGDEIHVDNHFAAANPLDPGYIYFGNDGGLYRFKETDCNNCQDCFPHYEDLSAGLFISQYYDISVSQQNNSLLSGGTQDNGSFFRSTANQWQFYAPTGDGMIGAIDPSNDQFQYWTYQSGTINRYENGQNTCISCNIPNDEHGKGEWVTPFVLDPNNSATIIAGYSRIYRSYDRGDSWQDISGALIDGLFDEVAIAPGDSKYVYAIEQSQIFSTANANSGGLSIWQEYPLPVGTVSSLEVHPSDPKTIFITMSGYNEGDKVFKSTDRGKTWINLSGSLPNVPAMVIKTLRDPNYEEALFVGTSAGVFYQEKGMEDWLEYGNLPHTLVMDIEFQHLNQSIRIGTYGRAIFEAPLPLSPCLRNNGADQDNDGICDAFDICPNGDDLLDLDNDGAPDACENYCLAAGAPGTGADYISNIQLNTIDHNSEQTKYSDFSHLKTELNVGAAYTLSVKLNYAFPLDAAYAWIDFNRNKTFDEHESIEMGPFNTDHTSFGSIILPEDAIPGETILRVRNIYTDNQSAIACDSYFGEVEDYTVNIIGISTSSKKTTAANLAVHIAPNPGQDFFTLSLDGPSIKEAVYLSISDFSGRIILGKRFTAQEALSSLNIPTAHLNNGLYLIKVQIGEKQLIQKWVKL
jgi:photosystem II stability/assembly factor-like uncharacterized protein